MPVERKNRNRELVAVCVTTVVMLGIYAVLQSSIVRDWWKGMSYDESGAMAEIRRDLELTGTGERIFLATQPAIEDAEVFNEHCDSHKKEISLLGCYTNDRMYIYKVETEGLEESNKVTAAHELLHAVWMRLSKKERNEVETMLRAFWRQNADWVEEELKLYNEDERIEELYTRVGTKVRDLPEDLEEHYREYFKNRLKIVDYYEGYQAPFRELQEKSAELKTKIDDLSREIAAGRNEYDTRLEKLKSEIGSFNWCAEVAGCFRSDAEFASRRKAIKDEEQSLNELREKLNVKIDENNALVLEYNASQRALGELNDALNSNVNKIEGEING